MMEMASRPADYGARVRLGNDKPEADQWTAEERTDKGCRQWISCGKFIRGTGGISHQVHHGWPITAGPSRLAHHGKHIMASRSRRRGAWHGGEGRSDQR